MSGTAAALRVIGCVAEVREAMREAWGTLWPENLLRDVRIGWRSLRRSPAFTGAAVLTLALGIGATTAVFTLVNWLLIRPVPGVAAPEELVVVRLERESGQGTGISDANIQDLQSATPALTALVGWQGGSANLQARVSNGAPFVVRGTVVQGDYFGLLGLKPHVGRWFTEDEWSTRGAGTVIVISERFWLARLGGAPTVVGSSILLNAQPYTIVGVARRGFHGTERTLDLDIWLPPAAYGRLQHRSVDLSQRARSASVFFELVGRLRRGATPGLAQAQLRDGMVALVAQYPDANAVYKANIPAVYAGIGLPVLVRDSTARTLRLLLWVVSVLLLIAIANLVNLMLVRGASRFADSSVRLALGATRERVLQQHLVEGFLLVLVGGAAGVCLALAFSTGFEGQSLLGLPVIDKLPLDWRVVAFAFGAAALAGLISSFVSGLATVGPTAWRGIKAVSPKAGGAQGRILRNSFTVLQIAAAITMVSGALLLVRTVTNLRAVPLGFDPKGVFVFGYNPSPQGYDVGARRTLDERLIRTVLSTPGVTSASLGSALPMAVGSTYAVAAEGEGTTIQAYGLEVTAEYFKTLGTPLAAGRSFTADEQYSRAEAGRGVVLSSAAARALFSDGQAVGRIVRVRGPVATDQMVLGVTEDVRLRGRRGPPTAAIYLPLGAAFQPTRFLVVRSALPRGQTERRVTDVLAGIDSSIPFFRVEAFSDGVLRPIAEENLLAKLLSICALMSVTLAAVGVYGVVAYSIAQRRHEIGVRMALGAARTRIAALMVRQTLHLLVIGSVLGLGGAYALSRVLASRLFGIAAVDPFAYGWALASLAAVSIAASLIPALRAASVDVVAALRPE